MTPERHVSDDPARALAERIAALLRQSSGPVSLALSGGSTPIPMHRVLAQLPDVPWERVRLFLVDERFVPLDDEQSNFRMIRETLIEPAGLAECDVYPVPTHLGTAEEAATAYEVTVRGVLGAEPAWDIAVMGMGDDGHTASLFPGDDFMTDERLIAATHAPPTSPVEHRVTATLALLNRSRHVLYLVTGAGKRDLVRRVFEDADACPDVPAACVRGTESTAWFLDPAAGATT